jgi:hypothetical protein
LQNVHGDKWQDYWNTWLLDQAWMSLIRHAEGGDILTRAQWSNGALSLNHFYLTGEGRDVLSGAYELNDLSANAQRLDSVALANIYATSHEGMSAFRVDANGNVKIVATTGDVGVFLHTVTREDVRAQGLAEWAAITAIGRGVSPLLGLVLGAAKALGAPEWGELPGKKVGDVRLRIALNVDLPEFTRVSGYETVLRNGNNLGRDGIFDGTATWDIPKRIVRHY